MCVYGLWNAGTFWRLDLRRGRLLFSHAPPLSRSCVFGGARERPGHTCFCRVRVDFFLISHLARSSIRVYLSKICVGYFFGDLKGTAFCAMFTSCRIDFYICCNDGLSISLLVRTSGIIRFCVWWCWFSQFVPREFRNFESACVHTCIFMARQQGSLVRRGSEARTVERMLYTRMTLCFVPCGACNYIRKFESWIFRNAISMPNDFATRV